MKQYCTPLCSPLLLLPLLLMSVGCAEGEGPTGPGEPARLTMVSGGGQADTVDATLDEPIVVKAVDASGRPVEGVVIAWSTEGGVIRPLSRTTDVTGTVMAEWSLGVEVGTDTAVASAGSLGSVRFSATVRPGQPANLELQPDTTRFTAGGDTDTLRATGEDRYGNPVNLEPHELSWSSNSPQIAVVSPAGVVQSEASGDTYIRAVHDNGSSGISHVSVRQHPVTIVVTPDSAVIEALGDTAFIALTALDRNGYSVRRAYVDFLHTYTDTTVAKDAHGRDPDNIPGDWIVAAAVGEGVATVEIRAHNDWFYGAPDSTSIYVRP